MDLWVVVVGAFILPKEVYGFQDETRCSSRQIVDNNGNSNDDNDDDKDVVVKFYHCRNILQEVERKMVTCFIYMTT